MLRLQKRDWIILADVGLGYGVYSKWPEDGLRRTEADMKSIPIGAVSFVVIYVDQGGVLINPQRKVAVIDKPDQFDAQETARQVQIGVCNNAENSSTMKKEGFSYEYHYKTKDGLALTDFKVTTCE